MRNEISAMWTAQNVNKMKLKNQRMVNSVAFAVFRCYLHFKSTQSEWSTRPFWRQWRQVLLHHQWQFIHCRHLLDIYSKSDNWNNIVVSFILVNYEGNYELKFWQDLQSHRLDFITNDGHENIKFWIKNSRMEESWKV